MEELFTADYWLIWALLLATALFYPVRQLIWTLYVRRSEAQNKGPIDETARQSLKRRATFTAVLLVFIFSVLYANQFFKGA